jgi:hypothetical protein
MMHAIFERVFTMKALIRAAFTVLSLASIGAAHSQATSYHTPVNIAYQTN